MNNFKKTLLPAACVALTVAVAPAAGAATPLGNSTASATANCSAFTVYIGGAGYTIPSDGVITSWRVNRDSGIGYEALKIIGPGSSPSNKVITGSSEFEFFTTTGEVSRNTRISVKANDQLGLYGTSDQHCRVGATGENVSFSNATVGGNGAVGSSFTLFGSPITNSRLVVSATLEPDADRDGFGDETQDGCPANPARQAAPCVPVAVAPPCKVPSLKGKTKGAATTALKNANCKLGTVKKKKLKHFTKKQKRNRVRSQSVAAGKVVAAGTSVTITVNTKQS